MKTYIRLGIWLGAGLTVALASGVAMAQMPAADGMPPMARGEEAGGGGPGGGGAGGGPHGPPWMRGMMGHPMGHMPAPSKAAHFRFRKGEAMVDIKCADDEPMKACVEAGSALLDKLAAAAK